jgi:hypothetical protein
MKRKYNEFQTEEDMLRNNFYALIEKSSYDPDVTIEFIRAWIEENNFNINFVYDPLLPYRTVIHAYAVNGNQRAVEVLLALGANVDGLIEGAPANELSTFYSVVETGYTNIALLFQNNGANVNTVTQDTVLHQDFGLINISPGGEEGRNIHDDSSGRMEMQLAQEESQNETVYSSSSSSPVILARVDHTAQGFLSISASVANMGFTSLASYSTENFNDV